MIKWPKVHFQETYRIKSGIGIHSVHYSFILGRIGIGCMCNICGSAFVKVYAFSQGIPQVLISLPRPKPQVVLTKGVFTLGVRDFSVDSPNTMLIIWDLH